MVGGAVILYSRSTATVRRTLNLSEQRLIAKASAIELLELFRSFSRTQLNNYLAKNPVTNSVAAADLYPLCSHRNIIDRARSTQAVVLMNPDPVANLSNSLLDGATPSLKANRFFQIQVINSATLSVVTSACTATPPYAFAVNSPETFLVTVGVTWVPAGNAQPEREVVSAMMLPE